MQSRDYLNMGHGTWDIGKEVRNPSRWGIVARASGLPAGRCRLPQNPTASSRAVGHKQNSPHKDQRLLF